MVYKAHQSFIVADRSYLSLIKRDIHNKAISVGFEAHRLGELDIIIAELTSNLLKHTTEKKGELLIRSFILNDEPGMELICIDNGPGMTDPDRMMQDKVSTTNTLGQGLGAIRRLSDEFDMYSVHSWGTVIVARVFKKRKERKYVPPKTSLTVGAILVPKPGQEACGDGWSMKQINDDTYQVIGIDGLGHGPHAQIAAQEASARFQECTNMGPVETLKHIHDEIKKTRGVVGLMTEINIKTGKMMFCGIGNISGRLITPTRIQACVSYNGIIGHTAPTNLHPKSIDWEKNSVLILCSDGIKARWDQQKYVRLFSHDPSTIAAAIYKDHTRKTDDSLVLVARLND